ncbi:MAG: endonuclease/exonuclease/phosphatase family protein [Patescibacteria group bacterium]
MKIISLNCWGGKIQGGLLEFVRTRAADTDVFCFQEVWRDTGETELVPPFHAQAARELFEKFREILTDFDGYFAQSYGDDYGLATFVRKDFDVVSAESRFVYKEGPRVELQPGLEGDHARNVQIVTLTDGLRIANIHGLWKKGRGKDDTPERLEQSMILTGVLSGNVPTVLIGDFNLWPDTESVRMIERAGFRNLVREYGVTSTRTELFPKEFVPFADYAFTKGVEVADFQVLPDVVSDHNPLLVTTA